MSYLPFSRHLAGYLADHAGLPPEKEVVLIYVIEVLAINLFNMLLALLLGLLLGVLPGTVACLTVAFLFRHTAGGAHSSSPWRCGIVTVFVFPLIALFAAFLTSLKQPYADILSVAAALIGLITIILLAPVDCPAAPIISPARRRKLKILSLIIMLALAAALVVLRQSPWVYAREIQFCLVLTTLWISLMLGKAGHRLISFIDSIKIK